MPLKIVRNDITQMNTDAIVNTANKNVQVGPGCDFAIYNAAGYEKLLTYRRENIGNVSEGEAFLTPSFQLSCKYIIHAVSPLFQDG
ncbi:MAG: macro domain-containing protein, partial [Eubacteriales bacterium]|nr:macro domain-containing protein [Eubacteriales bacterium]